MDHTRLKENTGLPLSEKSENVPKMCLNLTDEQTGQF